MIWIQGNLLVADYGPLDGTAIEWTGSRGAPLRDCAVDNDSRVTVVAARYVSPVATFARRARCGADDACGGISSGRRPRRNAQWKGPSDSMFDCRDATTSSTVLDAFQSDVFEEILEEDRQELDRTLSGAVFFADHAAAFPTTW